ncbi:MAG: c-type cytochrome, partial [Gemmatimonadetes bacterium]|nr:c-type cytochrome [Gemmatimonadota bacterium]
GVDREGKPLVFMPSNELRPMSEADLAAVIAFMRSVPPVNRAVPEPRVGPVARALSLSPGFPLIPARLIDHDSPPPPAPTPAVTVAYGKYLATVGLCTGCHLPDLSGGGGPPPGATNITPDPETGIGNWTEADFFRALRTGMRPNHTPIDQVMPWVAAGQMTDDEIRAVWLYLRSLPAQRNPQNPAGGGVRSTAKPD